MTQKPKQFGFTLTEMLVVVAVIAILLGISIPASKALLESFDTSAGTRALINAALTNARAIAIREQRYAGVRFQQAPDGRQYMVFILHDPAVTGLANGFYAIESRNPMRLPTNTTVIDRTWVQRTYIGTGALQSAVDGPLTDLLLSNAPANMIEGRNRYWNDATTFSIVFSPTGHLTTHRVWVRNNSGIPDTNANGAAVIPDQIFNRKVEVDNDAALLYQDDYGGSGTIRPPGNQNYGIGPESSRRQLVIVNTQRLAEASPALRVTNYLSTLPVEMVNPHTGELVVR